MKKIYSIVLSLFAVLAVASCVEEKLTVFNPEVSKAQVLGEIAGCTLAEDGENLTVAFDSASFSVATPVGYSFYMAPSGSEEGTKLTSTIADGTISVKQKDLNSAILALEFEAGVEVALDFWLIATLNNDKGAAIAGSEIKSNVVTAKFVAYSTDVNDVDKYEHVWIIGNSATIGGWDHGKVYQYLYNYSKDGKTFEGLIDYGEDTAAGGWKITGIAGWDDSCNWGSEAQAEEAEASSITLISSGGSKDIKCYSKRFYKWEFDKEALTLKKIYGFNNVGLVGTINGWNQADPEMKMEYNAYKHRFYIDYTFDSDSEIKFTCDDAWTLNWGAELSGGDGNIKAPAGSYRIYLDLNAMEYKFDAKMFGQDEPGLPAAGGGSDTPEESWSITGLGNDWNTDYDMTEGEAGVWKYSALTLTETDEFKIRKDHAWTTSVGGPEANATSTIDPANPYDVYKPVLGTAFATGDKNIAVQVAGTYDVIYDVNNGTITITDAVPAGAKPIHIFMKSMGWETNNLYGWGTHESFAWPGIPATGTAVLEGQEYVYWTLDKMNWGKEGVGLIFNNGSVQTVDIAPVTLDGNKCYELGDLADGKHTYSALPLPGIKITYTNPAGWDAVSLYGWGDFAFGDWPGTAMTKNGDVFEYVISGDHFGESASIIFNNNGAGAQTADLGPYVFTKDETYDAPAK